MIYSQSGQWLTDVLIITQNIQEVKIAPHDSSHRQPFRFARGLLVIEVKIQNYS
jgi:hypothetical protein